MKHSNAATDNSKKNRSIFQGDKFLCFLLFLIGSTGLCCIFFAPKHQKSIVYNQSKPRTASPPADTQTRPMQVTLDQLDINGYFEANEELAFHITGFDKKLSYELDLGNRKIIKIKEPITHYTYWHSGKYKVKLWGTYKGEKRLLHRETIRIDEAIEVAENALFDVED